MGNFVNKIFKREFFKKDISLAVCFALMLTVFLNLAGFDTGCESLRNNVLRLHILANSDSEEDQKLKLEVRDAILLESNGVLNGAESKIDAINLTSVNLEKFKEVSENVVKKYGKDYPVNVKIEKTYFNTREYENFTLPAGEYDALRVLIGKGEGKNWWCIMFPAMCVPAAGTSTNLKDVTGSSAEKIAMGKSKYKIKFKTVEVYENLKRKIGNIICKNS